VRWRLEGKVVLGTDWGVGHWIPGKPVSGWNPRLETKGNLCCTVMKGPANQGVEKTTLPIPKSRTSRVAPGEGNQPSPDRLRLFTKVGLGMYAAVPKGTNRVRLTADQPRRGSPPN